MAEIWKVCGIDRGVYRSIGEAGCFTLEYWLGEATDSIAGTVGILCFPAREDAETFCLSMYGPLALLRCSTNHVPKEIDVVFAFCWQGENWRRGEELLRHATMEDSPVALGGSLMPAPPGTVTVPSLTPLECVGGRWEKRHG